MAAPNDSCDAEALAALRAALQRVAPVGGAAWAALAAALRLRRVPAHAHLLRSGEPAQRIVFLHRGLLREYYLDAQGREATRRFCQPGEFSGSLADLLAGGPAASSIEALEPCDLLEMPWAELDALAERHADLMRLLRRFAEALYVRKTQREFEMLTQGAAERWRRFAQEEPALEARLPRHMVASYLGITPVHLSRLRPAAPSTPAAAGRRGRS